jgi:hypothetical protein
LWGLRVEKEYAPWRAVGRDFRFKEEEDFVLET